MASGLSNNTDITSNENEDGFIKKIKNRNDSGGGAAKKNKKGNNCEDGFIEEIDAENSVTREILAKWLAMDQTDATTGSRTNESFQPSEHGQKFDVFLSHSGKQKNIVRQLHRDLTNQGVSCFFDQDPESLPLAENFPSRIFEAARTCKVAVLLLSKDFLESKWPMLELSAFVEARDKNPNLKILPLFFKISPGDLRNTKESDEKWKQLEISEEKRSEWQQALDAIRPINGLPFAEGGDEVKFRDEIVKEIWNILPTPSPRYHVRGMQGEARMCQEVANFFNEVQPKKKGIRIVGLYGLAGHGKTTLGKAFCNFRLGEFEGKVCHLEFSRGHPLERTKLALQYLAHRTQSYVQTLTIEDQAKVELFRRVQGKRVLLVLDNITEESREEVVDYLKADFGENSWILLSGRSGNVLEKYFQIEKHSCMHVPRLEEEEAVAILLERAFPVESTLKAEDTCFALKCANRCLFKESSCDNAPRARTFHPLALKAFGGYLFSKYGLNLPKWGAEIDDVVDRPGDSFDEVFAVLGRAFDDMPAKHRTIFMLLTVYMLPNTSLEKVIEWMAISCNEKISFIEKAVQDLCKMAFIEEFEPEIRIHDLYIEFAKSKADKMERWLWCKEEQSYDPRGLISEDKEGFELAKLEQCTYETMEPEYVGNLFVLQLIDVQNMSTFDLGSMNKLRSITLRDCKLLEALYGMEKLRDLAWLQIIGVNPMFKLPDLTRLKRLQHFEINIKGSQVLEQLGDLSHCSRLREINVDCPSLLEFPRLKGMQHLERIEFSLCDKVKGPLDCRDCVKLQTIVLNLCCQMAASPLLSGCKNLSKLILSKCDAVTASPDIEAPSALKTLELSISSKAASAPKHLESLCELENLELHNIEELMELPSLKRLSNLTVLKLVKCSIREPPDLTGCHRLEVVYFFQLKNLQRFPSFSSLRELKTLNLSNCTSVKDPPDIEGCQKLQAFHLIYNDYIKGLPRMDMCAELEEIQVSWHSAGEVQYQGFHPYSCQVDDDLEFCLEYFKDEKFGKISDVVVPEALEKLQWLKGKTKLVKRYFRGLRLYYSLTAPYEDGPSKVCRRKTIILGMVNGKVTPSPTVAKDFQDRNWIKKVEGYFAAQKDIAPAIVTSDEAKAISRLVPQPSKRYHVPTRAESMCHVITHLLPAPLERYHVPAMQGVARMCQELADFFNSVHPNQYGIRIAGLYGMPGMGKSTLCKGFCNLSLENFHGKVCYLEFCGGNKLDRKKFALQYLFRCGMSYLESLTTEREVMNIFHSEALRSLCYIGCGQRVLLVLDNITQESVEEVKYYLRLPLGQNSCVLLSARSEDVLAMNFNIDSKSRISVPGVEEEEAIAILLERTCLAESELGVERRGLALQCANRCSFKKTRRNIVGAVRTFCPLALKTFGRHLFSKYGANLSQWVAEADSLVFENGYGLGDVFIVLDKAFDYMDPKYRTIFMLLTLYMQPLVSPLNVNEWLAFICKEEIEYIEKAVEDLRQKGFIEEVEPEIRIHDLFAEFAQSKARKTKRWLRCERDLVTSEAGEGFKLTNLKYCQHLDLSTIGDTLIRNLWALQVVDVKTQMRNLRFSLMKHLRMVTSHNSKYLGVLEVMENLPYLALLQVGMVTDLRVFNLGSLNVLQYLEVHIGYIGEPIELGDLTGCVSLREIHVRCRSLSQFPRIIGLQHLESTSFKFCDEVIGPLDCSNCVNLRSIVFEDCSQMAHIPLIVGCSKLSKIVFNGCDPITNYSDGYESIALEIPELQISSEDDSGPRHSECCDGFKKRPLWNIVSMWHAPMTRLSNLTVLKLYKCEISKPPDVKCCSMLEEVYFYKLRYLESFPNFSSLRKLKKLCLYDCCWVRAPPDIEGCEVLEVFHLLCNDGIEELPQMDGCPLLQEIKLSWHSKEEAEDNGWNNVEFCPDYQKEEIFRKLNDVLMPVELKEWQWIQDKTVRVKKYSRRGKFYYCMTAPYV